jgi:uncharacterized phage protein (TIGR01671 family)
MNRLIKFRVWDKITNQYLQELGIYYWHIPYSLDGEEITGEANLVGLSELLRHDNFVVQQYTGLTDKNKNLIYEGDIVKFSRLFEKERKIKELKSFVRFRNGQFGFDLIGFNDMFFTLSDECGIEVIGNIFEHPELLN